MLSQELSPKIQVMLQEKSSKEKRRLFAIKLFPNHPLTPFFRAADFQHQHSKVKKSNKLVCINDAYSSSM